MRADKKIYPYVMNPYRRAGSWQWHFWHYVTRMRGYRWDENLSAEERQIIRNWLRDILAYLRGRGEYPALSPRDLPEPYCHRYLLTDERTGTEYVGEIYPLEGQKRR